MLHIPTYNTMFTGVKLMFTKHKYEILDYSKQTANEFHVLDTYLLFEILDVL